ncbi:conserved hypothetical protein [Pseudomonas putida GB-1]|uniref:Uncharacterized protein n=1 Tax=Pseudomonas putida (strain GB-1) TaxID=76869 RepID=B0KIZ5_PSEPG|nr:conserved hypothetical protein [Pseudomonas putida GB-1]
MPQARDGSTFSPALKKAGGFTVGRKGSEQKIEHYPDALAYLRSQPSAHWRRPNAEGNWGIVSAVRWININEA